MPDIDFFISGQEKVELIQHVLDAQAEFIPDLNYSTPNFQSLHTREEVIARISDTKLFFISREDFSTSPLKMRKVVKQGKEFFYISPRSGGPTIQFYSGPEYEKNDIHYIASSFLSYYPWYENTILKENEKPHSSLVQLYKELDAFIRFRCERIKPGVRTYWICKRIASDVRVGAKLVGLENFSGDQIMNSRKPGDRKL